ncbi:hypothetical protein [Mucilaginibacter pedocola]|uniref:Uncharacterized protein n=1 Tax=Mucilaginibacter pedocola TaxID=1792845 RepID=A0A1S9PB99_9SPHI|nr:hypothetical protein [Mucilaginibacter pedocola]OOQ58254.1 hypothetical protein BC343_11470 [Mucilaginibacter pedocola]
MRSSPPTGLIIFILLVFISIRAVGQKGYFRIKPITNTKYTGKLQFPILLKDTSKGVAIEKINQFLQLAELELLNGHQHDNIFEKVAVGKVGLYGNKSDLSYSIYSNNNKTLSIGLQETASGMTMHYWSSYYTFNSGNGDLIQLSDLFTKTGYQQFRKQVVKKATRQLKEQVEEMGDQATFTWLTDALASLKEINNFDFYLQRDTIVVNAEAILPKEGRAQFDMHLKFHLSEFKQWLDDQGKCLFNINKADIASYRCRSLPQLFAGNIGKHRILLIIRPSYGDEYQGIYCYEKFGKGIYMEGKITKGHITMEEKTEDFDTQATISGVFRQDSIIATWKKNGNSVRLPLFAHRK